MYQNDYQVLIARNCFSMAQEVIKFNIQYFKKYESLNTEEKMVTFQYKCGTYDIYLRVQDC